MDLFGLEREAKILRSGVRNVFTPHQPIKSLDLFFGRQDEVGKLIEHLNTPGQHALLFGDRGVGKSSLANITCELILRSFVDGELLTKRCDSSDTFLSVVEIPLQKMGIDIQVTGTEKEKAQGGKAGVAIPFFEAGVDSTSVSKILRAGPGCAALSPSWVASQIHSLRGLFFIDEADALRSPEDKKKLAELIKLLSDQGSSLKVLMVGIAETANELTAGHPSVTRCLRETRLSRMSDLELQTIISGGEDKIDVAFSSSASARIVAVSSGYPHFTHLLCLKAAENAIAEGRKTIDATHLDAATKRAVQDAEGSLRNSYDAATRSFGTDEFKRILLAAARCNPEEFTAAHLRQEYKVLWGIDITQGKLNNHFKRLVSDDGITVLRRLAKGVYRFSDPRMPSYVRIAQSHLGN
jgi:hypothetical protein